ncbi:MAG: hypothetical protein ABIQ90_01225 [Polaromonas sp.]
MRDEPSARVHIDIERAILDHLARHPRAADSAVGVARWWLGAQGAAVGLADVELALRQLVSRHALRLETLADGTTLYSKNGKLAP